MIRSMLMALPDWALQLTARRSPARTTPTPAAARW